MKNRTLLLLLLALSSMRAYSAAGFDPVAASAPALATPVIDPNPAPRYTYEKLYYSLNGGIERTAKGRLWVNWMGGNGGAGAFALLAWSDDDGKTWTQPRFVLDPHDSSLRMSRSTLLSNLWTDPDGRLWWFFGQSMMAFDGRGGLWSSVCENPDAEQPLWSKPIRISDGFTLNKPTLLSNGEWMLPVSLWDRGKITKPFEDAFHDLDDQRMAHVYVSNDKGKTWIRRGGVRYPMPQYDEHMIVERRDGALWMTARTRRGLHESFSHDGGRSWSDPRPAATIKQGATRHFVRRLKSGNILMVKNGVDAGRMAQGRSQLTAFLSTDDGLTWQGRLLLDGGGVAAYPDGIEADDGRIYVTYDAERNGLGEIRMAKFTEAEILAGRFVDPRSNQRILVSRALAITAERLSKGEPLPPDEANARGPAKK
jgi:hypothetical protein